MKIILIAAIAPDGVIGDSTTNSIPWQGKYPQDMEHFKKVTMGHAVVMGRNTWESIPAKFRPLPGRSNHVVSSRDVGVGAWRCTCLADAIIGADAQGHDTLYVIGGSRLYAETLPIADELDITLVAEKWEGDVKFPGGEYFVNSDWVQSAWLDGKKPSSWLLECVSREPCPTNPDLTFTRWVRR